MGTMEAFVIGLSSHRACRDLFWHLATIAPLLLVVLLCLLFSSRIRRAAAVGLACSAAGALLFALLFHHTYALGIWRGHDSAIRSLDQAALLAGFAAGAVVYAFALSICAGVVRLAWRT